MTPEELVLLIDKEIIQDNLLLYRDMLSSNRMPSSEKRDDLTLIYEGLPEASREAFFRLIERVQIDTVSNILGVLDGTSYSSSNAGRFQLTFDEGVNLTGDLQDLFIDHLQDQARL